MVAGGSNPGAAEMIAILITYEMEWNGIINNNSLSAYILSGTPICCMLNRVERRARGTD